MGSFAAGSVVLADSGRGDWLLCQITSKPYADSRAIEITDKDFRTGSLRVISYARSAKLFTAHHILISSEIGVLSDDSLKRITNAIINLLQPKA